MYQAIYKCRLCGEEIQSGQTGQKIAKSEIVYLCVGTSGRYSTNDRIPHDCKDGSFGVADFQGFKKLIKGETIKNIHAESVGYGLQLVVMADVRNDILKDVTQSCFDICENAFYIGERYKDGYSKIISVCSYPLERAEKLMRDMTEHFKKVGD